jgi:hypothetical protein
MKYLIIILFLSVSVALQAQKVSGVDSPTKVSGTAVSKVSGVEFSASFSNDKYFTFAGTDDQAVTFNSSLMDFDAGENWYIIYHIKTSASGRNTAFSKDGWYGSESPSNRYGFAAQTNGTALHVQGRDTGGSTSTADGLGTANDGAWKRVIVNNEGDDTVRIYVNSATSNVKTKVEGEDWEIDNDIDVIIGSEYVFSAYSGELNGSVDWIVTGTETLTLSEITAIMAVSNIDDLEHPDQYITDWSTSGNFFIPCGEGIGGNSDSFSGTIYAEDEDGTSISSSSIANCGSASIDTH